jgi:hypothetical protein
VPRGDRWPRRLDALAELGMGTDKDAKAAGEEFGRGGGRTQGGEARRRGLRETGREAWHQCTTTMAKAP